MGRRRALRLAALALAAGASGLLTMAFEIARSAWMAHPALGGRQPSETAAFALAGWLHQGLGAALLACVDAGIRFAGQLVTLAAAAAAVLARARLWRTRTGNPG